MKKILFVCLGNICRSPMAEAIMNNLITDENIKAFSCGTASYHVGEKPHKETLKKLKEHNIETNYLKASVLKEDDYLHYDYIIAMDENNLADIYRKFKKTKEELSKEKVIIKKLLPYDVPDPWYTGNFDETYKLSVEGCTKLFEEIKKG